MTRTTARAGCGVCASLTWGMNDRTPTSRLCAGARKHSAIVIYVGVAIVVLAVSLQDLGTRSNGALAAILALGAVLLRYGSTVRADERHHLLVRPEGLLVDAKLACPRGVLREGVVLPQGSAPPLLFFRTHGLRPNREFLLADRVEGRALLEALGLDAAHAPVTFTLPSKVLTSAWGAILFSLPVTACVALGLAVWGLDAAVRALIVGLGFAALELLLARPKLVVGAEGVRLMTIDGKRYVSWRDVESIAPCASEGVAGAHGSGVELRLRTGTTLRIQCVWGALDTAFVRDTIVERMREAWYAYRERAHRDVALVGRGSDPAARWVERIRASIGPADYRTEAQSLDRLWATLEDAAADPALRVGAAVALSARLDDAGRTRLRVAAHATVLPEVRTVFETVARGAGDEELIASIEAVEAAEPHRHGKRGDETP